VADYYPLIARAVAGLAQNTGEDRRALYDRARDALVTQLRKLTPALSESDIIRERGALDDAIRKVEMEVSERSQTTNFPARASGHRFAGNSITAKQLHLLSGVLAIVMFAGLAWVFVFGVLAWNGYLPSIAGEPNKPATVTFFLAWWGPAAIGIAGFVLAVTRAQAKSAMEKSERLARGESEPVVEKPQRSVMQTRFHNAVGQFFSGLAACGFTVLLAILSQSEVVSRTHNTFWAWLVTVGCGIGGVLMLLTSVVEMLRTFRK
jgi:hypothetical protein